MLGPRPPTFSARRLTAYLIVGALGGGVYAALNTYFDYLVRQGTLPAVLDALHGFVDRGLPVLAGALMGVAVHYVHLRSALARAEAQRAADSNLRLSRVERNQAVWIVAAATLHEVNNPLHSLGLLLDEVNALPPGDEQTRAGLLERARANADRIQDHLGALRTVTGSARPQLSTVSLQSIALDLARDMAPLASQHNIALEMDATRAVHAKGDPTFVRIIVENLMRNALEVMHARGEGHLAIAVEETGDQAVIRVSDDGPGIPQAVMRELFEPLSTKKPRGLGLGLAIARALARAMNGELGCAAHPGWTTSFVLRLPLEAS